MSEATECEEADQAPALPKILRKDLTHQFGTKAPEKLQRLLFMLRENKDVFQVFIKNIIQFSFEHQITDLAEAIVHFMFLDLVEPTMHTKLNYLVYEIIYEKCQYLDDQGKQDEEFTAYESKFKLELFKELTKSLEAKQCAQSMFVVKYERLDTNFLN